MTKSERLALNKAINSNKVTFNTPAGKALRSEFIKSILAHESSVKFNLGVIVL